MRAEISHGSLQWAEHKKYNYLYITTPGPTYFHSFRSYTTPSYSYKSFSFPPSLCQFRPPSLHFSLPPCFSPSLPPSPLPSLSSSLPPSLPLSFPASLLSSLPPSLSPSLPLYLPSLLPSLSPSFISSLPFPLPIPLSLPPSSYRKSYLKVTWACSLSHSLLAWDEKARPFFFCRTSAHYCNDHVSVAR